MLMNENSIRNHKIATFDIGDTNAGQILDLAKPATDAWTTVVTAADRVTCEMMFIYISHVVPNKELNEEFTLQRRHGNREK